MGPGCEAEEGGAGGGREGGREGDWRRRGDGGIRKLRRDLSRDSHRGEAGDVEQYPRMNYLSAKGIFSIFFSCVSAGLFFIGGISLMIRTPFLTYMYVCPNLTMSGPLSFALPTVVAGDGTLA